MPPARPIWGQGHTFESLLTASGVDLVAIRAAMGHSALATTSRYLHARPAGDQAQAFTAAFAPAPLGAQDDRLPAG
jgi:hypothetical protein